MTFNTQRRLECAALRCSKLTRTAARTQPSPSPRNCAESCDMKMANHRSVWHNSARKTLEFRTVQLFLQLSYSFMTTRFLRVSCPTCTHTTAWPMWTSACLSPEFHPIAAPLYGFLHNSDMQHKYLEYQSTEMTNAKKYSGYRFALFSFSLSFSFFLIRNVTCKIMVGCRSSTYPSILLKKSTHVVDSLVRTTKKWRAVSKSTCASEPQLSSYRRWLQTGETPEKLTRIFRLLGPCLEPLLRKGGAHMWESWENCTHVGFLGLLRNWHSC